MNRRALQVIEINVYAEAARAVRAALKKRDEGEREAAAILSKQLKALGEAKWLEWCEREFGWKRSTAYRHLDPEGSEKARVDTAERRATSQQLRHEPEEDPGVLFRDQVRRRPLRRGPPPQRLLHVPARGRCSGSPRGERRSCGL